MKKQTIFTLACLFGIAIVGIIGFNINNEQEKNINYIASESKDNINEKESITKKSDSISSDLVESISAESEVTTSEIRMISDISDDYIDQLVSLEVEILSIENNQAGNLNIKTRDDSGTILLTVPESYIQSNSFVKGTLLEITGLVKKKGNSYQVIPENSESIVILSSPQNNNIISSGNSTTANEKDAIFKERSETPKEIVLNSDELTSEHHQKIVTVEGVFYEGFGGYAEGAIYIPSGQKVNVNLNDAIINEIESSLKNNDIVRLTGVVEKSASFYITPISASAITRLDFFGEDTLNEMDISTLEEDFLGHIFRFKGIPQSITYSDSDVSFYLNDQTGLTKMNAPTYIIEEGKEEEFKASLNNASLNSDEMTFEAKVGPSLESNEPPTLELINFRNE